MEIKLIIEADESGFVDTDQLKAFLDGLPKLQQVIAHAYLTSKFYNLGVSSEMVRARANWLYNGEG